MSKAANFSLLLYPFRFTQSGAAAAPFSPAAIWQPSTLGITESYFHEHVRHFVNCNQERAAGTDLSPDHLQFFQLKPGLAKTRAGASVEKLFTAELALTFREERYPFVFFEGLKRGLFSPTLVLLPRAGVGYVSVSLQPGGEGPMTISDHLDFNYSCRALNTRGRNLPRIRPADPEGDSRVRELCEQLGEDGGISLYALFDFLLADFPEDALRPLSRKHLQLFSFHRSPEELPVTAAAQSVLQLARAYNDNYELSDRTLSDHGQYLNAFRNIYLAVSQEGGAILLSGQEEGAAPFFREFVSGVVKTRYLWIYLLVYLQRLSLLNTTYTINELLDQHSSPEEIGRRIEDLSQIQLKYLFSEVSSITMHNQFHAHCRDQLRVTDLFSELRREIFDLNLIVTQRAEEERQRDRRTRLELEATQQRETEKLQERQTRFERRLNVVLFSLGLLTFLSVWKDFSDIIVDGVSAAEWSSFAQLLLVVVGVTGVLYWVNRSLRG